MALIFENDFETTLNDYDRHGGGRSHSYSRRVDPQNVQPGRVLRIRNIIGQGSSGVADPPWDAFNNGEMIHRTELIPSNRVARAVAGHNWVGFYVMIPPSWPRNTARDYDWVVAQCICPPFDGTDWVLQISRNNEWIFDVRETIAGVEPRSDDRTNLGPVQFGVWERFVIHHNRRATASGGAEVWREGTKLVDYSGISATSEEPLGFIKLGLYNRRNVDPSETGDIYDAYFDEHKIAQNDADDFDTVNPDAVSSTPTPTSGYRSHLYDLNSLNNPQRVTNTTQLKNAMDSANPGDVIEIEDGTYNLGNHTMSRNGTEDNPIVIRYAQNQNGPIINGGGLLTISGDWVYVEGLRFVNYHILLQHDGAGGGKCRITRCQFIRSNRSNGALEIQDSSENRVDHCLFDDARNRCLAVNPDNAASDAAALTDTSIQFNLIDQNDFTRGRTINQNGRETMNLGRGSDDSIIPCFTLVEYNRFHNVHNDEETISVKSSGNVMQFNTFISTFVPTFGDNNKDRFVDLSLRHGNDNKAIGNTFEGYRRITIRGTDNQAIGNVMRYGNLSGNNASIRLARGNVENDAGSWNGGAAANHPIAKRGVVAGNVIDGRIERGTTGGPGSDPTQTLNVPILDCIVQGNTTGRSTIIESETNTQTSGFTGAIPVAVEVTEAEVGVDAPDRRIGGSTDVPTIATITQNITEGAVLGPDIFEWTAVPNPINGAVLFKVDGETVLRETTPPFGDTGTTAVLDFLNWNNPSRYGSGPHTLRVELETDPTVFNQVNVTMDVQSITQNLVDGSTIPVGEFEWIATIDPVDDAVLFFVDGAQVNRETSVPFGDRVNTHPDFVDWRHTRRYSQGVHTMLVQKETDGIFDSVQVTLTAPTITQNISENMVIGDGNFTWTATVNLDDDVIEFLIDDVVVGTSSSAPHEFTIIPGTTVVAGTYDFYVRKQNHFPTSSVVANAAVTETPEASTISQNVLANDIIGPDLFTWTATLSPENDSVEFLIDDVVVSTDATAPYSYAFTPNTDHPIGAHTLKVRKLGDPTTVLDEVTGVRFVTDVLPTPQEVIIVGTPTISDVGDGTQKIELIVDLDDVPPPEE